MSTAIQLKTNLNRSKSSLAAPSIQASPEKLEWIERQNRTLEGQTAEAILAWAVEEYFPHFGMATGFGPEGCVIISMLAKIEPRVYIFNLDTGYQFPETLALRKRLIERYGVSIELARPELSVAEYESQNGGPIYRTNPDQCCYDRKVSVLRRVASNLDAWATGIRRSQSPTRANAPVLQWDRKFGLVKISPLVRWTKNDVWKRIVNEDIPYNPLHDLGYPSIGCKPCTRAILEGQDERAGRWVGFAKTECGIHTAND